MSDRLITDVRGREFAPVRRPARVVSLVPSITELLFDLGLDDTEIVGRTRFCIHPRERIRRIPSMGGTKDFKIERIIKQQPSLIIANVDENRFEDVQALEDALPDSPVFVTHPCSFREALLMICDIGTLLHAEKQARRIGESMLDIRDRDRSRAASPVRALYLIWKNPYMSVAPGTYIHDMLSQTGYANCIDADFLDAKVFDTPGQMRYPTLKVEDIARLRPAEILLSSEPYPFKRIHFEELRAQLAAIDRDYAATVSIRLVDGEYYSWYGSRMMNIRRVKGESLSL